eukprot:TRINITY_DN9373_c0_g1_i10.p1 TRINITY_DN9373_c0_g1~~TRINITY_DN9373_c0_g1_i10.p1  ORF type:complete len:440 (+),score=136.98 TRINITY_DN9373_c0_g1_i10:222-1541(+)
MVSFCVSPSLMILSRPNNVSLVKFLCKTAEKLPNLALKAYWTFLGYVNEAAALKCSSSWAEAVLESVETHMVNGRREAVGAESLVFFSDKIYRAEYMSLQNSFVESLTLAAIQLKAFDQEARRVKLKTFLTEKNQWIEEKLREKKIDEKSKYSTYYKGIVLPFEVGDDKDPTQVVSIVPELGTCYNTKRRAPYRIVFETIKLSEASQWNEKMGMETHGNESFDKMSMKSTLYTEMKDNKKHTLKLLYNPEQFANYSKEEIKHLVNRRHTVTHSNRNSRAQSLVVHKRRIHSEGDAIKSARSQFNYALAKVTRRCSELQLRNVLEKYGKKAIQEVVKEDFGYIPLVKRIEGMEDPFGESWKSIIERQRKKSPYGAFETYAVRAYIVKGNDDLRQELMAMQFMKQMQRIYVKAGIQVFLRPYEIIITSHNSGMIGTFWLKA